MTVHPRLDAERKDDPHVLREARNGFMPLFFDRLPGLALTSAIAATAVILQGLSGIAALSPLLIAMALGVALRAMLGPIPSARIGIVFSLRRVLRFAIVLLGLQLTVWQVMNIGATGFAIIVTTLIASFVFTNLAGRLLGIDRRLTELIAVGTSICGASAVIAANTVTRAPEEDVAYAIACVTVFGTMAMLLLPALATAFELEAQTYGLWMGATIHEVAQAVAAAFQGGDAAGQAGTVAKLSRVMLLAPLILTLGLFKMRRQTAEIATGGKIPVPWFVFGFIATLALNSAIALPADLQRAIAIAASFLLAVALGAMGLETDIAKLRAKGAAPFLLGFLSSAFIASFGLGLTAVFAV